MAGFLISFSTLLKLTDATFRQFFGQQSPTNQNTAALRLRMIKIKLNKAEREKPSFR